MKVLISFFIILTLTGCSTVQKYWPRDHDNALVSRYVDLEVKLQKADCSAKDTLNTAILDADWLSRYTQFRDDPQQNNVKLVLENLQKAANSTEAACKRWVSLTNVNMKVIKKAWEGR